jgi:hypothetical protein
MNFAKVTLSHSWIGAIISKSRFRNSLRMNLSVIWRFRIAVMSRNVKSWENSTFLCKAQWLRHNYWRRTETLQAEKVESSRRFASSTIFRRVSYKNFHGFCIECKHFERNYCFSKLKIISYTKSKVTLDDIAAFKQHWNKLEKFCCVPFVIDSGISAEQLNKKFKDLFNTTGIKTNSYVDNSCIFSWFKALKKWCI